MVSDELHEFEKIYYTEYYFERLDFLIIKAF